MTICPHEATVQHTPAFGKRGEGDALLIRVLFETGLRISEALQITLKHLEHFEGYPAVRIIGKGDKPRLASCPKALAESLQAYAYRNQLEVGDRVFAINRKRAHQIVSVAGKRAGLNKDVFPHLLRHSDAIERLRQTGIPRRYRFILDTPHHL